MPSPATLAARRGRITTRLEERDDFGIVLLLILATIMTVSLGAGAIGQFVGVCLSGFTLLFVLHTSGAHRRTFRAALAIVVVAVAGAAVGLLSGAEQASTAAGLIGLLLAFAAPVVILRRILSSPTITVRLVLGALAIYLLVGLTYAYLYPVISAADGPTVLRPDSHARGDRLRLLQLRDADDRRLRRLHGIHQRGSDDRGV